MRPPLTTAPRPPSRRWRPLRIGLRGLMILVLVAGGWLGWFAHSVRVQREAVRAIEQSGGSVVYDFQINGPDVDPMGFMGMRINEKARPRGPRWLVDQLGVDGFGTVVEANLGDKTDDATLEHVGRLVRLDFLGLDGSQVTHAGLRSLGNLHLLRTLLFGASIRASREGLECLEGMDHLETLYLQTQRLRDDDLIPIGRVSSLKRLLLDSTEMTDRGLAHLEGLTSLEELDYSGDRVTDAGTPHLRRMVRMKVLGLGDSLITSNGLKPLRGMTDLRFLRLTSRRVPTPAPQPGLAQVDDLDLGRTPIDAAGLADLATLPDLACLQLNSTAVDDAALIHLRGMRALAYLDLSHSSVSGPGLVHLIKLPKLTSLNLVQTKVADPALETLAKITSLKDFAVSRARFTPEALNAFEQARPDVKFQAW